MYSNDLREAILKYYNKTKLSMRKLETIFNVSKSTINRWINNINVQIHKKSTATRFIRNTKILKSNLCKFLKRSLILNPYQTLLELRTKIKNKFRIILSETTISKYLSSINYSKKKILRRYFSKNVNELIKNNFKKQVRKIGIEKLISVDETSINRNTYMNYGWCVKGKQSFHKVNRNKMFNKFNILVAISENGVLSHEIYKNKSINETIFHNFIRNLSNNYSDTKFLLDNVSFHKSKLIKNDKHLKDKLLYIPPYSPELNPIEEYFHELKTKTKKRLLRSNDVEKIVKDICRKTGNLFNYFHHSFY
jgi:transposase